MTTPTVNWQPLPSGQDILIQEGLLYAVVGMVDVAQAKILQFAANKGIQVDTSTYQDNVDVNSTTPPLPPPKSGYRYVAGMATAVKGGATIPWSVPSPWSVFDSSTLVRAWAAQPAGNTNPLPVLSCPPAPSAWSAILGGAVGGVLLYEAGRYIWHRGSSHGRR